MEYNLIGQDLPPQATLTLPFQEWEDKALFLGRHVYIPGFRSA